MISTGNPKVPKGLREVYEKYNPEKADDANVDKIMKHFHGGAPGLTYTDLFSKLWAKYEIAGDPPHFEHAPGTTGKQGGGGGGGARRQGGAGAGGGGGKGGGKGGQGRGGPPGGRGQQQR